MNATTLSYALVLALAASLAACSADETCATDADCLDRGPNYLCDQATSTCECVPACDGLECGLDGCGGTCQPGCTPETQCENGVCVCRPDCISKECGDDGCGGSCGSCTGVSDDCDATGTCWDITEGALKNTCQENIPICNTTAGCVLLWDDYLEGDFPGAISFVVHSSGEQWIDILILFKPRTDQGTATEIRWYTPDCNDFNIQFNDGSTLFSDDSYLAQSGPIGQGAHLVEISSDATAHYYLRAIAQ
ncbi:MAG: hypothetical protein KAI66_22430 [Lentisphaeria bacterium]|nr:hypothetical protein [Lentisphaeria bacterium]